MNSSSRVFLIQSLSSFINMSAKASKASKVIYKSYLLPSAVNIALINNRLFPSKLWRYNTNLAINSINNNNNNNNNNNPNNNTSNNNNNTNESETVSLSGR